MHVNWQLLVRLVVLFISDLGNCFADDMVDRGVQNLEYLHPQIRYMVSLADNRVECVSSKEWADTDEFCSEVPEFEISG